MSCRGQCGTVVKVVKAACLECHAVGSVVQWLKWLMLPAWKSCRGQCGTVVKVVNAACLECHAVDSVVQWLKWLKLPVWNVMPWAVWYSG